ncbi:MAG: DUF4394 domain-containing protein [Pirellulaceae bacterium]|nr:DUF4394 domain-containing protein [Planctomycetales bacterium]
MMYRSTAVTFVLLLSTAASGEQLVALVEPVVGEQLLYVFDSATPAVGATAVISGLGNSEQLLAIDYRPLTGELYGLSSGSAIYTIAASTGIATKVGSGFTDALNGGNFGFDFNPVIDRIRIVSDADQNLVAHPDTGNANVATTFAVAYGTGDVNEGAQPNVVHHAYDGVVFGALATSTQLRAIDSNLDILVSQANNAGTLGTIGPLGVDAEDIGGFDIATTGNAFAAMSDGVGSVTSTLYSIDLDTGAATSIGAIPYTVWGLAANPVPEPNSLGLLTFLTLVTMSYLRTR